MLLNSPNRKGTRPTGDGANFAWIEPVAKQALP